MALDGAPEDRGGFQFLPAAWLLAAALSGWPAAAAGPAGLAAAAGPARPLDLDRAEGGRVGLGDFAGRPVLVHFWATWCAPCVEELASLDRLARDRPGLPILAVDVGEVDLRVRAFLEAHPVSFPVALDRDRGAARAWGVVALPSSFLLDPGHRPVGFVEGDLHWDDPAVGRQLDELLQGGETNGDDQPT